MSGRFSVHRHFPTPGSDRHLSAARGAAASRRPPAAQHLRTALPADDRRCPRGVAHAGHDPTREPGDQAHQPEIYPTGCAGVGVVQGNRRRPLPSSRCAVYAGFRLPKSRVKYDVSAKCFRRGTISPATSRNPTTATSIANACSPCSSRFSNCTASMAIGTCSKRYRVRPLVTSLAMRRHSSRATTGAVGNRNPVERSEMLATLIEMAVMQKSPGSGAKQ